MNQKGFGYIDAQSLAILKADIAHRKRKRTFIRPLIE